MRIILFLSIGIGHAGLTGGGEQGAEMIFPDLSEEDVKEVEKMELKDKVLDKMRKKRGRVVGGSDVKSPREYPEYVSLRYYSSGGAFCGASVLDETHILTAAHCTKPEWTKSGDIMRDGSGGQIIAIKKCIPHPKTAKPAKGTWPWDYMICELSRPLKIDGTTVKKIEIGTEDEFEKYVKTKKAPCEVIGMGRAGEGGTGVYKTKLQKVKHFYSDAGNSKLRAYLQDESFAVEGNFGTSACNGDSGGPLFCTINGKRKQFGVASWALTNCSKWSGWFRPGAVIDWIKQNSNYKGGGSSSSSSSSRSSGSSSNSWSSPKKSSSWSLKKSPSKKTRGSSSSSSGWSNSRQPQTTTRSYIRTTKAPTRTQTRAPSRSTSRSTSTTKGDYAKKQEWKSDIAKVAADLMNLSDRLHRLQKTIS